MDNEQKTIEKIAKELLGNLEIEAKAKISKNEDSSYSVKIEGDGLGILIGYHGETLNAFQLILSLIAYKKLEKWVHILVDVGDYRSERSKKLEEIATAAAQKARFLQKKIELYPMSSYERMVVHSAVSKVGGVKSESEGEGYTRHVVISPA